MGESKRHIAAAGAGAVLLLVATADLPYGFYTFLRLAVTGIAIFLIVASVRQGKSGWLFGLVPMALLWNPLIPVAFSREAWLPLDLIGGIFLAILCATLAQTNKVRPHRESPGALPLVSDPLSVASPSGTRELSAPPPRAEDAWIGPVVPPGLPANSPRRSNRGWIIATVVLSVALVIMFVAIVAGSQSLRYVDPDTTMVTISELSVDDCIGDLPEGEFEFIPVIPCSAVHYFQAYFIGVLPGESYPTESGLDQTGESVCISEFESFVGIAYDDSALYYELLYPSEAEWDSGVRVFTCVLVEYDETDEILPVEGTLRGGGY